MKTEQIERTEIRHIENKIKDVISDLEGLRSNLEDDKYRRKHIQEITERVIELNNLIFYGG